MNNKITCALNDILYRPAVKIGKVFIGGGHPIVIQSMTDTPTENIKATVQQIIELANAGAEIVRCTINTEESARSIPFIKEQLLTYGYDIPIVGCFHYNGHTILKNVPECASSLDKYRINPGNVGFGQKRDRQFEFIINCAIAYGKPVRIGVNWGSLDKNLLTRLMEENSKSTSPKSSNLVMRDAIIESTILSANHAINIGLNLNQIVVSAKVSNVHDLVEIYKEIFNRTSYALHLGLTEPGSNLQGTVKTAVALGILLNQGIGDTIRASVTPGVTEPRHKEVLICKEILQSLSLRYFHPSLTSCPGCGRTNNKYFKLLTEEINNFINLSIDQWKQVYPDVVKLKIAVMGCIVNGPGESKHADIGISLPGSGENPVAAVFIDGKKSFTLHGNNIANDFKFIINEYISNKATNIKINNSKHFL